MTNVIKLKCEHKPPRELSNCYIEDALRVIRRFQETGGSNYIKLAKALLDNADEEAKREREQQARMDAYANELNDDPMIVAENIRAANVWHFAQIGFEAGVVNSELYFNKDNE